MKKYKVMMVAVLGIIALLLSFGPMPVATTVGQETNELGSVNISGKVGGDGIGGMGEVSSVSMSGVASGIEHYVDMGKGLEEPCWPWRECMVFGADLGTPDANDWNCIPEIIGRTDSFDLSTITPNHDVAIALIVFYNVTEELPVTFKWYRNRDNKLIYQSWYTIPEPCEECYVYGYIGYAPEEIWENGNYHLHIIWSPSDFRVLDFEIEGIPPPLERYAPVLYLHPNEDYYTDSIESVLNESDLRLWDGGNETKILSTPTRNQLSSYNTNYHYLDMWNATPAPFGLFFLAEHPDPDRFTGYPYTVYGRQVEKTYQGDDYIVLQYWFFYPYNYWLNCHEGDMERIQIICDKATETPQRVTFGQHHGGESVVWDTANISLVAETHPKVFVAVGSHSSWSNDGPHKVSLFTDYTSDAGTALFPADVSSSEITGVNTTYPYTLDDISSEPSWVNWLGKWGQYVPGILGGYGACGPDSPANIRINGINVWNDPMAWDANPGSPSLAAQATGSMRVHAYDSSGNHTGLNETGGIETEIPGTYFYVPASNLSEAELMWIYTEENLTFTIEASEVGECNFSFARCIEGEITTNYTHVEVIKNTTAKVDTGEENPLLLMELDFDSDGVTDELRFPDSNSTLKGQVSFAGRGDAPNDKWIEPFDVTLFESGNLSNVLWTGVATTNNTGVFTIDNVPSGTYDIGIKNWTCLSELVTNITVGVNQTIEVDFGVPREGDASGDDYVDGSDYAILSYAWLSYPGHPNWDAKADFNRDNYVDGSDYGVLSYNWLKWGDLYGV